MALGPRGTELAPLSAGATPPLASDDLAFANGLENMVDRALRRHPAGEPFVYGIHQAMSPAVLELIRERYRAAGWGTVSLKEGATGAVLLVLAP